MTGLTLGLGLQLGGRGGGPAPAPGLIVSDFKNASYSIGGVAAAVEDIWGNSNFGEFTAGSDISAGVGLISGYPELDMTLLGANREAFTLVVEWTMATDADSGSIFIERTVDGVDNHNIECIPQGDGTVNQMTYWSDSQDDRITGQNGANKTAITFTDTLVAASTNGEAAASGVPTLALSSEGTTLHQLAAEADLVIEKVTYYQAQPAAALPELSGA